MDIFLYIILGLAVILYGISIFSGRKMASQIAINLFMATEENENITGQIRLPANSSPKEIFNKVNSFYEATEMRRKYQADRMFKIQQETIEKARALQEQEGNVSDLAKKRKEKGK